MYHLRNLSFGLLLCSLNLAALGKPLEREIAFACPESADSPVFQALERTYAQFFIAYDYQFSMTTATEKRMILEIVKGRYDGACGQSAPVFKRLNNPRLTQAQTPIAQLLIKTLSRHDLSNIESLDQLQNTPFKIGIIANTGTALLAKQLNVRFQNIHTIDRGVKMLAAGRLDYVVSNHLQLNRVLGSIDSIAPLYLSKALLTIDIYPTLNQQHSHLIPALEAYLTQLHHCLDGPLSLANREQWLKVSSTVIEQCLDQVPPQKPTR